MNVKLKKFSIVKPKIKITTGLKTITRETQGNNNVPLPNKIIIASSGAAITGHAEMGVL